MSSDLRSLVGIGLKGLLFVAISFFTWRSFAVPDANLFNEPSLARMIFFHLSCALSCTLFFYQGAYLSWKTLKTRQLTWDVRAVSANEIGLLLAALTMVTGIIFSKVQWLQYWSWDPRQTSFLFVLLLYGAYFILRGSIADPQDKARISAAYALYCVLPATFCIFVLPRIMFSLHPSDTIVKSKMDADYTTVFLSLFICVLVLSSWIYQVAVRAGLLELKLQEKNGKLESRGSDTAVTGVVRPVSLSDKS